MKNAPLYRRILSVALVVAMLLSVMVPAISAAPDKSSESKVEELSLTPIDPGTLESRMKFTSEDTAVNKEDHKLTDVVRVSIVLDKASTVEAGFGLDKIAQNAAAKAYREGLRADQAAVTAKIEKAIGGKLDVKWNLTLAANIISANVMYGKIDAIKAIDGVRAVVLEQRMELDEGEKADQPNNGSASYMIGSNITWANGYTGAGSKVAIIDSGTDHEHQSFSGEALEYALAQNAEAKGMSYEEYVASLDLLTAEKIEAVKDQLNVSIDSAKVHVNTKVAFAYNYIDGDYDVLHINDTGSEHGSHVAGIAAANRFVKINGEFKPALEEVGTQGVAPDAQIVTMKVFGKGGGAYPDDYMAAIEDAIILGCDSANLSLGSSSAGFGFSDYEDVFNMLVEKGMVVSFSAGNNGMWYDTPYNSAMPYPYMYIDDAKYATGGSPESYTNTLSVASVDNAGNTGMPLIFGDKHVFYNETSGYGNSPIGTIAGKEYEYVFINSPGVDDNTHVGAEGDDFMALGKEVLEGKVAMCFRGSSSFFAKANAAVAQGAVAVVIVNNQPGAINMNLTGYNYTAPAVSILQADGLAIMEASEAVKDEEGNVLYYTGTMRVGEKIEYQIPEISDTVSVSSFSSYGTPGTMVLKPEIMAPGGSIYSVFAKNNGQDGITGGNDQYEMMSGTSMAAPQVAGMAAVLGQYIRENGLCEKTGLTARQLINSLLMSTAHPVFDAEGNYWPVFRVGAGLANVADASSAMSYILMDENATLFPDSAKDGKVKAELGDDPECKGEYSFSFTYYPMEGKREFTLRTDIFTQGVAGNAGYGMLQDTATMLIGANVTYDIDGTTYEDTYLVEADVNMDGVTDEADAQAILDHLTGKEAEDAKFDAKAADVDGDGKITSYDAKLILDSASTPTVQITEPTKVTVNIKLDEDWMALLLGYYFTKGFYVEGYTYIDPVADEEGVQDVTHSIPIYGFCGSWTDPSMFDRSSVIDAAYGTGKTPYMNNTNTNYMALRYGEDAANVPYMGNPYMVEDKFPADRLALSTTTTVQMFNYLNIRNARTVVFAVQDEDGKVIFCSASPAGNNGYAPYYYANGGSWQNTGSKNFNVAKKLGSTGVKEGDKITVGFYALPEYYAIAAAKLNGEVATKGNVTADEFAALMDAGLIGDGAAIKYTVTVDDTAPVVKGAMKDLITGNIFVQCSDDNYIAYVALMNNSGSKVFFETVPEQTEAGAEIQVPMELEGISLPKEVTLLVGDYAGNEVAFKVSLGGEEEDAEPIMLGFVPAGSTAAPGTGNRAWEIDRENLSYNYSAGTFTGLAVYGSVPAAVTAAEYVEGYVFMACDDGWFYAADINALDEASRVGKYADTVELIYDMAFNYKDKTLYALGNNNIIYTVDLITGKLTPAIALTLAGVTGTNAVANRLAIDDEGIFYTANYGGTSAAKLFKFEKPAPAEPEEPEPEVPANVVAGFYFDDDADPTAGWTFVDADGDGKNWEHSATASPAGQSGSGKIVSYSYQGGALTPDNWAISPAADLSGKTDTKVSFWAQNWSTTYADTIAFYVGTSTNPDEMVKLGADVVPASGEWTNYTFALPAELANASELHAAIRHYNCSDMYRIYIDTVEFLGEDAQPGEEPEEPEEPVVEPVAVTAAAVSNSAMGVYNFNNGGAFAWDHNTGTLYLASNYSKTQDYDHYLWVVNTETGKAAKANNSNASYSARLYGNVCGLLIVPVETTVIKPTDTATDLIVEPEELSILKGQTVTVTATVMPWTVNEKEVTWESADPAIATVKDGEVTGVAVGETTITVTTVAEPNLSAEITVTVEDVPAAEVRGVIWDESGHGMASVFTTNVPNEWTAIQEIGNYTWAALVDDTLFASTGDTMYAIDADTYEVTTLGGIVSDWIPSDAVGMPEDLVLAWGLEAGFRVGGLCNNGTYFEVLDPVGGSLNYWNLSTAYASDPMAVIAYIGRADYSYNGTVYENCAQYFMMTESGELWLFTFNDQGSLIRAPYASTGIKLEGVSDVTGNNKASMVYDEESNFLYVASYDGNGEIAVLYAIDAEDPARNALVGDFNDAVWPVVGLYQYEPATDLVLKVNPTDVELFETQTAELNIKVKMGETNEYTVEIADPTVISLEDGVITALKEGETTITVTTVDTNEAGEKLTATVNVKVKGLTALDATIKGQVTDAKGARFTSILLDGPVASKKGEEAPFDVYSGARAGDIYLAGTTTKMIALDAETFQQVAFDGVDSLYATYPAMDVANYPVFIDAESGELDEHKALMTTSVGYLVTPDYYGWNLGSYLPDMAALAFAGTDTTDDGSDLYIYYLLTTAGELYEIDIIPSQGKIDGLYDLLNTGITVADQGNLSMAFLETVKLDAQGEPVLDQVGLVVANNEDKTLWFIDFQTGEVGMVGTLEADNVSGLIGTFDSLVSVVDGYEPTPAVPVETVASFGFENDPAADGWTFVDADGDNNNWLWSNASTSISVYEGQSCIYSQSYNASGALTPDNWAISPAIDLSELDNAKLSVYAVGQDPDYAGEVFALYAGTSANPEEMVKVSDDFTATGSWKAYTADLADFAGEEEVYVAVRHYNISDMFYLNIDQVEILTEGEAPASHAAFDASALRAPVIGDGTAAANSAAKLDFSFEAVEMTKLGETANEVNGGLNAIKGEAVDTGKRELADETTAADGEVTIVLTDDEAVTNGLYEITYDPEVLSFVSALAEMEYYSVNEKDGVITFAFASVEEIEAETVLATLKFSYEGETVDTVVTVDVLERSDDVAVEETLEIPVKVENHDCPCAMFKDMPEYGTIEHAAIDWAFTHEPFITDGIADDEFGVNMTVNRGQAVTFLYRASGNPEVSGTTPFTDLTQDWYKNPVLWAYTADPQITDGMTETTFEPDTTLNRAMLLTFLYRQQGKPSFEASDAFAEVPEWYRDAMQWALAKGIITADTVWNEDCPRVDVVVYLFRVYEPEAAAAFN